MQILEHGRRHHRVIKAALLIAVIIGVMIMIISLGQLWLLFRQYMDKHHLSVRQFWQGTL